MNSDRNRRRSSRIADERPIEVGGTNLGGVDFLAPSHTILLSRYGAKIQCEQALGPDQEITIFHPKTGENCLARVIELYDHLSSGYTYGIEFLDPDHDFWNFAFPPASEIGEQSVPVEPLPPRAINLATRSKVLVPQREKPSVSEFRADAMPEMTTRLLAIHEMVEWAPPVSDRQAGPADERIQTKRQRESRNQRSIRVRVYGTDGRGNPFSQTAYSVDISRSGACLEGVGFLTTPGMELEVKRGWKKARFRVVWVGKPGTPRAGQVGVLCLEPENNIWGIRQSQ